MRGHHAATGVEPAQQRFHAHHAPRTQVDDRLVVEAQLAGFDGAAKLAVELKAVGRLLEHEMVESLHPVLALLLRCVHRRVGIAQHHFDGGARRRFGQTDAGPDQYLASANEDGLADRIEHSLGQHIGEFRPGVFDQNGELVAAQP